MGIIYLARVRMGTKMNIFGIKMGIGLRMGMTAWESEGTGTKINSRTPLI